MTMFENRARSIVGLCRVFDSWVRDLNIEAFKVLRDRYCYHTAMRAFGPHFSRDPNELFNGCLKMAFQMFDPGAKWLDYSMKQLKKIKGA